MPWMNSGKRLEINLGNVPTPAKAAQMAAEAGVSLTPPSPSRSFSRLQWEDGFWEHFDDPDEPQPPQLQCEPLIPPLQPATAAGRAAAARASEPLQTAAGRAAAARAAAAAAPAAATGGLPHSVNNRVRVVVSCCTEDEDSSAE